MIGLGIALCLLVSVFIYGASLMLTSLRPRVRVGTWCVRCGTELGGPHAEVCPKCRRLLTDELRVTCSQGEIDRRRLLRGGAIVAIVLATTPFVLRYFGAEVDAAPPSSAP